MDATAPDFDLLAASLRSDARDLRTFLEVLASKLQGALPGRVTVSRDGGLFARDHPVRRVEVTLATRHYSIGYEGAEVVAKVASPGSAEQIVPLDRAIESLSRDVAAEARASSRAREVMDALVSGGLPAAAVGRPAEASGEILYRYPDNPLPALATIVVAGDDSAVAIHPGGTAGPVGAGRHTLAELGVLPEPGRDDVEVNLWFCAGREFPGLKFGGMVDKVSDPETGLAVGLRVFGEYSLQVSDPIRAIASLPDAAHSGNAQFTDLMRGLLLKVLREDLVKHIASRGWGILGLAAHTDEIEAESLRGLRQAAAPYGLVVPRLGNFTISMKEEDEALLTQHLASVAASAPPAGREQVCAACGAANPAEARFCQGCGKPLLIACPSCGTRNAPGARFCQNCGTALAAAGPAGG